MVSFADVYQTWGVTRSSLQASYAMAENVFAVTQTSGSDLQLFGRPDVRAGGNTNEPLPFALVEDVYVSSGHPIPGAEIRISHSSGRLCADREPGGIQIRSESLFKGYWGSKGVTAASFRDGEWYDTGDYGFLAGNELYVIGRTKDIVIIGGQNVFPEDIETVVGSVSGIYPGRVVAFGVSDETYGTEALAVVAEMRGPYRADLAKALEREIHRSVVAAIGVAPRYVFVSPERWIVKSTAGKLSRTDTRQRFLESREHAAPADLTTP